MTNDIENSPQIAQIGNSVLKLKANTVTSYAGMTRKIAQMMAAMKQAGGVGIAAPQLSISERIFIIASKPNRRYPDAPLVEPFAMINPALEQSSESTCWFWEGCLSVPKIRGNIERPTSVRVTYQNIAGEFNECQLDGFLARVFMHELDHLDGILFPDRIENPENLVSESDYFEKINPIK